MDSCDNQLAWTQWNSRLRKERKSWDNVRNKQKDLSPPLIHFPAALSSCWPARFNSSACSCVSHNSWFVWRSLSFLNLSAPATSLLCSLSLPSLFTNPMLAWLPHWKQTTLSLTLPCSAICLSPLLSDERLRWIHWMDEVRMKLHHWLQPGSCIPAHTDQVSAGVLLKEAVLVYVPKLSKPRIPW